MKHPYRPPLKLVWAWLTELKFLCAQKQSSLARGPIRHFISTDTSLGQQHLVFLKTFSSTIKAQSVTGGTLGLTNLVIGKLSRSGELEDVLSIEGQLLEGSLEPGDVGADLRPRVDAADVHLAEPQQALGVLAGRNLGCGIRDVIG